MSVRVKREELFGKLQSVQPGLTAKEVIDQSSCLVFTPGMIMTYNDEVSCRTPYEALEEFTGAVKAKPLLELLGKLPEDEVELEEDGGELHVMGVGSRREAGIRMEKEILSAAGSVELPEEWSPLPESFPEALELVSACAGTDDSRFNMTCVHFHPKFIEACDNLQLARYRLRLPVQECIVKQTSLKQINTLGMTEIAQTGSWLHFRNASGLILSCRMYKEDKGGDLYPDMSGVLNIGESPAEATLPGGLAEEVERAKIFSAEGNDDKILVELRPGKMRVKGQGASGWFSVTKKMTYTGPSMEFLISPKLLIEITKKGNTCEVAPERMRIQGERYTYISCLTLPQQAGAANGKAKPEEETVGAGASQDVDEVPF
jgi:DNA polymerase III sliding clamp (beta) subunit (PCNA family)